MALYLMQRIQSGEPVGIISETDGSFYYNGFEGLQKQAERIVGYRGSAVPWEEFVDRKTRGTNHRFFWAAVEDDRNDLEEILLEARSRFQAE